MNRPISSEVGAAVRRLIADVTQKHDKEVAEATGGLVVYRGWTADLAVTPDGEVVEYDWEWDRGKITSVSYEGWRSLALRRAAQKFPELQELVPVRPSSAVSCPSCGGSGVIAMGKREFSCGACWEAGWIVLPKERKDGGPQ